MWELMDLIFKSFAPLGCIVTLNQIYVLGTEVSLLVEPVEIVLDAVRDMDVSMDNARSIQLLDRTVEVMHSAQIVYVIVQIRMHRELVQIKQFLLRIVMIKIIGIVLKLLIVMLLLILHGYQELVPMIIVDAINKDMWNVQRKILHHIYWLLYYLLNNMPVHLDPISQFHFH